MQSEREINFCWEARAPDRNMARFYRVSMSADLFGQYIVERAWGRCGARLRTAWRSYASVTEAEETVRNLCARRAAAERRLGVAYRRID